ncbi:MAG: hypothetical protein ACXWU1_05645 [Allosphingosinicella sp.]
MLIYRAGRQLWKVRAMMLLSLACAAGGAWWGWDLFSTYGLRPADGGELASLPERLAWGLVVSSLGFAFAAGMWAYGQLYVSAIRFDEEADRLLVRTVGFLAGRVRSYARSDVIESGYHAGRMDNPGGVSVDAPWFSLRLRGRRWPLIVDAQGDFPDPELAARLLRAD